MSTDTSLSPPASPHWDNAVPFVSICIPVYNGEQFISEAIYSILDQNYLNMEILVQDNASTDRTWNILESLSEKYPQLSLQRNACNVGMAPNWNIVINRATGDYIMLMSADDIMEQNYLQKCLKAFDEHKVDVVTTNHYLLKGSEKRKRRKYAAEGQYEFFCRQLLLFNPFPIVFALFKKQTLTRMLMRGNLFDEAFHFTCDYELLVRLSLSGVKLYYLEEPLATYRIHGENLSRQVMRMDRQAAMVILRHREELRNNCRLTYQFTLIRFLLRVLRNVLRCGKYDKKLFIVLLREVTHGC